MKKSQTHWPRTQPTIYWPKRRGALTAGAKITMLMYNMYNICTLCRSANVITSVTTKLSSAFHPINTPFTEDQMLWAEESNILSCIILFFIALSKCYWRGQSSGRSICVGSLKAAADGLERWFLTGGSGLKSGSSLFPRKHFFQYLLKNIETLSGFIKNNYWVVTIL